MKFISWNVNGLRAVAGKNFCEAFEALDADFFCLQETKLQEGQINLDFLGYYSYWNYAEKKGYSGTCIYTKHPPLSVRYGMGIREHDHEGRLIIYCGDLNVAHKEIALKNPQTNHENPGFTDQARDKMTTLLGSGFVDTFRYFHPDAEGQYSWWSYRMRARERNVGWRIDYFIVSERLCKRLESASIHQEIPGSDHCPVELVIE